MVVLLFNQISPITPTKYIKFKHFGFVRVHTHSLSRNMWAHQGQCIKCLMIVFRSSFFFRFGVQYVKEIIVLNHTNVCMLISPVATMSNSTFRFSLFIMNIKHYHYFWHGLNEAITIGCVFCSLKMCRHWWIFDLFRIHSLRIARTDECVKAVESGEREKQDKKLSRIGVMLD